VCLCFEQGELMETGRSEEFTTQKEIGGQRCSTDQDT